MRFHVINAIFRRNVASYFTGVLGYLLIIAFVVGVSFLLFNDAFFEKNLATLDQLSISFPALLLFIVPAITMTAWADERKLGTDELLFTLPATNLEVLLGKFKAVVAVYTILLAFTLPHLLILGWLGDPDWGLILTTYLGYWLAGVSLLALGLLASAMTNSTTVAFVIGILLCAIPVFLDRIPFFGDWLARFSIPEQLEDFTIGTIPIAGILYFASLAAFALYLNMVAITRRLWAGRRQNGGMGWQFAVRAVALLLALGSTTFMLRQAAGRVDLTSERLFTLSDGTEEVLANIPDDRVVTIQAYVSPEVPPDYAPVQRKLLGLLRQFDSVGGRQVAVRQVDVERYSDEADEAETLGIEARQVLDISDSGRQSVDEIYLGATVSSGFDKVVIPFFELGTGVEYELARAVGTVSRESRLTVGILETDAAVMGGGSGFSATPEWQIVEELGKQYDVKSIAPATLPAIAAGGEDAPKIDVLLAVLPSSLNEAGMNALVTYVESGEPVVIFDDPMPISAAGLQNAPREQKPSQGGPMGMGGPGEPKADGGRATRLVNALGIAWDYESVAFDDYNPHPEIADAIRPEIIFITPKSGVKTAINPKSPITRGLQEVLTFFPGVIQPRESTKRTFTPLLRTSKENSGLLRWDDLVESSGMAMFGGGLTLKENPSYRPDNAAHTIAAAIVRGSDDGDAPINAVYVADVDLIGDQLFQITEQKQANLSIDNITFLMNAIDHLAGDARFISIRSRRPEFRTLTVLDDRRKAIQRQQSDATVEFEEARDQQLTEFEEDLNTMVSKIEDDETLSDSEKQQQVLIAAQQRVRQLQLATDEANREFERQQDQAERAAQQSERGVERRTRFWAAVLPPIPAVLLGLFVLFSRLSDERRGVDRDRLIPN